MRSPSTRTGPRPWAGERAVLSGSVEGSLEDFDSPVLQQPFLTRDSSLDTPTGGAPNSARASSVDAKRRAGNTSSPAGPRSGAARGSTPGPAGTPAAPGPRLCQGLPWMSFSKAQRLCPPSHAPPPRHPHPPLAVPEPQGAAPAPSCACTAPRPQHPGPRGCWERQQRYSRGGGSVTERRGHRRGGSVAAAEESGPASRLGPASIESVVPRSLPVLGSGWAPSLNTVEPSSTSEGEREGGRATSWESSHGPPRRGGPEREREGWKVEGEREGGRGASWEPSQGPTRRGCYERERGRQVEDQGKRSPHWSRSASRRQSLGSAPESPMGTSTAQGSRGYSPYARTAEAGAHGASGSGEEGGGGLGRQDGHKDRGWRTHRGAGCHWRAAGRMRRVRRKGWERTGGGRVGM